MAQKVQVLLTCDLEETDKPAKETVQFTVGGTAYEIELCERHAKQFRDGLAPFVAKARRAGRAGGGRRRSSGGLSADRQRTQEIRAWARKKGIAVSERGRIAADLVAKYEASPDSKNR